MASVDIQEGFILPPVLSRVSDLIESRPAAFLAGDEETRAAALAATKYAFDLSLQRESGARPSIAQLLRSVEPSTRPQTRSQRKCKQSPSPPPRPQTDEEVWPPTPLESLHLDGMDDDQIWAQLELRTAALCEALKVVLEDAVAEEGTGSEGAGLRDQYEGFEGMEGLEDLYDMDEDDDLEEDDEDEEEGEEEDDDGFEEGLEEGVTELRDPSDEDENDEDQMDLDRPVRHSQKRKGVDGALPGKQHGGHPELDDGFFSLADFNAETEEAEAKAVSKGRLSQDDDNDDDVAEDDVDIFAAVDDVGGETFEEDDLEDSGEPYYQDFFAPPSRKALSAAKPALSAPAPEESNKISKVRFHDEVRVKKIKSRGRGQSVSSMKYGVSWEDDDDDDDDDVDFEDGFGMEDFDDDDDNDEEDEYLDEDDFRELEAEEEEASTEEGDGRETIERLKDDLFAEDEETPSKDLSTHEARQAEIAAQIAALEAQNIAPKEWTLMGEATSRSRPANSLLEEDLEFDRAMKVAPVVTEERVSSLEDLIKKRILDNRFDDVVRKRPADEKAFLPSRFFELNDKKSTQSLAQIYEDEYTATASGGTVDDRDGKLKKEHEELEKMWDSICHKLDALSNAHFTPKQPKATISTVSNLPTTSLESALPTTKSTTTMLAPEEIYAAPSDMRARDELTPIEKRAHRNKQRKARKKARDQIVTSVDKFARQQKPKSSAGSIRREKDKALKSVVKTGKGVTVVGKQSTELKKHGKGRQGVPVDGKKLKL